MKIQKIRGFLLLICAISAFANSTLAQAKTAPPNVAAVSPEKQREAEQVVIRAMRIFGQTLNFNNVYQNTYVKNRLVQKGEINDFLGELFDKSFYRQTSQKDLKKAYIKANECFFSFLFSYQIRKRKNILKILKRKLLKDLTGNNGCFMKSLMKAAIKIP